MRDSLLVSEEWCDIVFDGRRRDYGAYELRRSMGRRYQRALMVVIETVLLIADIILLQGGVNAYKQYRSIVEAIDDIKAITRLKEDDTVVVATGRRATVGTTQEEVTDIPVLTEDIVITQAAGIVGPDDAAKFIETLVVDLAENHYEDLSREIEGVHTVKTSVIDGKPEFIDGGDKGFIKWMDAHCPYKSAAINNRIQGDVEVTFIVDTEGRVIDVELTRRSNSALLNGAVMEAMNLMRKEVMWRPGAIGGQYVCCKICLPVHFQLS